MNYREAISYIEGREKFGIVLGLSRIGAILSRMENPQNSYRSIVVGGTNGKGSTVAMLSSVLSHAGYVVGAYTSPHLLEYTERIRLNDKDISKNDFAYAVSVVKKAIEALKFSKGAGPTVFEVLTAATLYHFAKAGADVAILEVGLGGRGDATNIVSPVVSVITNVDYDHTEVLGKRIEQIAREKAGIIKPGVPVVTAARGKALAVIERVSKNAGVVLVEARGSPKLKPPLMGEHQRRNLAVVLKVLKVLEGHGIKISAGEIKSGIGKTRWRGRFDVVSRKPQIILDGAHNPAGAMVLRKTLKGFKHKKPFTIILGILANKDVGGIIRILAPIADKIIATRSGHPNAASPSRVAREALKYISDVVVEQNVPDALRSALAGGEDRTVVVTGSLFTVADAMKALVY